MSDTPRQLGRYELVRRIAKGGMGEIHLARARGAAGFEKTVVIKKILPHLAEEEEFVDKFLDEGRIVVNLTHGNIVPVFDMDEVDGEYYIAMAYVPGRDLRDVLQRLRERDEVMPIDLAAYIVSEICEGLGYAHRQTDDNGDPLDIVHRDVSPSNVLLSTDGEVKLIDFGIAKAADRRAKTLSGKIQGKCCYMSPEQARGESLDARSDIFSTGVVLYEMLTGVRPFEGDSDLRSLELVRQCDVEPPSELNGEIPEEIEAVVARALAEAPDDRYPSIDAMQVDLMDYLYSQDRALTNQRIAEFLQDLYPEGPEREAFQEARLSSSVEESDEHAEALGLDEALEREFDKLEETAPDEASTERAELPERDEPEAFGRTETLSPAQGTSVADGSTDDVTSRGDGEDATGAEDAVDSSPSSEQSDGAETESDDISPEHAEGVEAAGDESMDGSAEDTGAEPPSDGPERASEDETRFEQFQIWVAMALAGLAVGGGVYAWMATGGATHGRVQIVTEPPGAAITVDGATLAGQTSPQTLRLRPGTHVVEVEAKGYTSEHVEFSLKAGEHRRLPIDLRAVDDASRDERRSVHIEVTPERARIRVDGRMRGTSPVELDLDEGASKFVEARADGCEAARRLVSYETASPVSLELDCEHNEALDTSRAPDVRPPDARSSERKDASPSRGRKRARSQQPSPSRREPATRKVRFTTTPPDAEVRVDGDVLGRTPLTETFARDARLDVRLGKEGYREVRLQVRVSELPGGRLRRTLEERETGCLDFFAVYPSYNRIAIDGEWLEGRRQKLEGYELPVGRHEIRVQNPNANRDETFTFEIDAGETCTSLTIWDPDADAS